MNTETVFYRYSIVGTFVSGRKRKAYPQFERIVEVSERTDDTDRAAVESASKRLEVMQARKGLAWVVVHRIVKTEHLTHTAEACGVSPDARLAWIDLA